MWMSWVLGIIAFLFFAYFPWNLRSLSFTPNTHLFHVCSSPNAQGDSTCQLCFSQPLWIGPNQKQKSQYWLQMQQWDIQATKAHSRSTHTNNKCSGRISTYSTTKVASTHPQVHKPQARTLTRAPPGQKFIAMYVWLTNSLNWIISISCFIKYNW